mmetsp:Transcript_11228/g.21674  ORF Transcript_11228/g.21674 Transcript_11228/m.21674 type:complete len:228 (-) Transcript_11228:60-743(-)
MDGFPRNTHCSILHKSHLALQQKGPLIECWRLRRCFYNDSKRVFASLQCAAQRQNNFRLVYIAVEDWRQRDCANSCHIATRLKRFGFGDLDLASRIHFFACTETDCQLRLYIWDASVGNTHVTHLLQIKANAVFTPAHSTCVFNQALNKPGAHAGRLGRGVDPQFEALYTGRRRSQVASQSCCWPSCKKGPRHTAGDCSSANDEAIFGKKDSHGCHHCQTRRLDHPE